MCGIVGYTGKEEALPILLEGLESLEYRGYDSAGISLVTDDGCKELRTIKSAGRLSALRAKLADSHINKSFCGIGHTRWATHGAPTDINSHPHTTALLSLVHNGIIENHTELGALLEQRGYSFTSDTDTERAAKLIDLLYAQMHDPISTLFEARKLLLGSYAFGIIFKDIPNKIYAMRKDSPLIVGRSESGSFLASDIPAMLHHTSHCCRIDENTIAELGTDSIEFYSAPFCKVAQSFEKVEWSAEQAKKGGFDHFMLKEIHEEPDVLKRVLSEKQRASMFSFRTHPDILNDLCEIRIIACGTAMHAGLVGKAMIEKFARIPTSVEIASEFRYSDPIIKDNTLFIFLSQSGETADTVAALRKAKDLGVSSLAFVNVFGSTLAREADEVVYTLAGPEIAVASTKAYSVQCALLTLLAITLGKKRGVLSTKTSEELLADLYSTLPTAIEQLILQSDKISHLADQILHSEHMFFIGRGIDYSIALEASLKLKEISYIHSEAYPAGELKHGTISLISEGTPAVAILTERALAQKTLYAVHELRSRGANVIFISSAEIAKAHSLCEDDSIVLPCAPPLILPILASTAAQLLAYFTAAKKGLDVDKPRNLAKSVTVE